MSRLASSAIERHHRDGFYFPVSVLTPGEALGMRRRLEAVEAEHGGALRGEIRHKPHLLTTPRWWRGRRRSSAAAPGSSASGSHAPAPAPVVTSP